MNQLLPQPPPNAPAPPPSAAALRSQKWRNWIWAVGILSVIGIVLLLPLVIRPHRHRGSDHTEAINNARQIGIALFEFETEYGHFPNATTIPMVRKANPTTTIPMGSSSSNDCFRQLIAAEIAQSERMFHARTSTSRKPDGVFLGTAALEKGECGFAYIAGLSSSDHPFTPIVIAPLVPGKRRFDYKLCKKYYGGKAIILHLDNSASSHPVDKSGHVYIGGKDLFDPTQPFWGGKVPDVKWPE